MTGGNYMLEIKLGEKRYRVDQAIEFMMASSMSYMQSIHAEMSRQNPDMGKVELEAEMAHNHILVVEDIVTTALRQGLRIEEEDLLRLRDMHHNVHLLLSTIHLAVQIRETLDHRDKKVSAPKTEGKPNLDLN